jgi:hypothetical protein
VGFEGDATMGFEGDVAVGFEGDVANARRMRVGDTTV